MQRVGIYGALMVNIADAGVARTGSSRVPHKAAVTFTTWKAAKPATRTGAVGTAGTGHAAAGR